MTGQTLMLPLTRMLPLFFGRWQVRWTVTVVVVRATTLNVAEPVQLRSPVEEVEGEGGDVLGVLAVLVHELGELHDAAAPDVGEVVQRSAVAALPGIEQHTLAQGVVGERHRFETELLEDLLEDQGAGEDDVGTPGVQSR